MKKSSKVYVSRRLENNRAAYSDGVVNRDSKDHTKSSVTDRLYKASKLGERKHAKADRFSLS